MNLTNKIIGAHRALQFFTHIQKYHNRFKTFFIHIPSSYFHTSSETFLKRESKNVEQPDKELAPRAQFFQEIKSKNKDTFLKILENYEAHDKIKRGHIELIYAALKYMEEFGVEADLESFKKLMDVFPKGKMIPKSLVQAEFFHFPRHQDCALVLLDQMEHNGVCPDKEMGEVIKTSFGVSSHVFKKYCRMMYWMPKLKNLNPYLLPRPLPDDVRELARLALNKMSVDLRTKITEFDTSTLEDAVDKTWIMSAQSIVQQRYINNHALEKALYVEGPYLEWLSKVSMTYFVLRADPINYPKYDDEDNGDDVSNILLHMFGDPKPKDIALRPQSVHEQEEGIIMAMCCTGTSSKDSLLSWIRFLRQTNTTLDDIPILFKLRTSPVSMVALNASKMDCAEQEIKNIPS